MSRSALGVIRFQSVPLVMANIGVWINPGLH